jgi:hypothetical protein
MTAIKPSYCMRHNAWYADEFSCPCWTDIPEPRRTALKEAMQSWYADFLKRHPEYDYGIAP